MSLGLGSSLSKTGLTTPGIVTDSLVMKHNYSAGAVVPVSDGACLFGGAATEDRITLASAQTFDVDGGSYTFAFWAKRNAIGANHTVLGVTDTSGATSQIMFNSSNELMIESLTGGDEITVTLNNIDTNWHHYAITITGSGATVVAYQDGSVAADSGDVASNNIRIDEIGATNSGGTSNEMDGYLCNIGIWDAVLTPPQVKSIMWKGYTGLTTTESEDLIHWWALDEGTGTSATDSKGSITGTFAS